MDVALQWHMVCPVLLPQPWVTPHSTQTPIHALTHPLNRYALPLTTLILTICRGAKALLVAQQVLQQSSMQELALFSLLASPKQKQLKIRLDKVRQSCLICTGRCPNDCSIIESACSMVDGDLAHQCMVA